MAASSKKVSVIVAGSRNITSYSHISGHLDVLFAKWDAAKPGLDVEIVSGTARGVDQLGEKYAASNDLECKKFPADWDRFGKSAGYKRNEQMAEYADALVAFWDGHSRGTRHMINLAKAAGISVSIIRSQHSAEIAWLDNLEETLGADHPKYIDALAALGLTPTCPEEN